MDKINEQSIRADLEIADKTQNYSIEITNFTRALHFQKYAKQVIKTDDEVEIIFENEKNVIVSREDFIEFLIFYKYEVEGATDNDSIRDAQNDLCCDLIESENA